VKQVGRCADVDQPPAVQHRDAIAQRFDVGQQVGAEEQRCARRLLGPARQRLKRARARGSRPLMGSSSTSSGRRASTQAMSPSFCAMPLE
jgi:hypothetical protein